MESLIGKSLMEVKLRTGAELHFESANLLLIVDQILATANVEAKTRNQVIETHIDPTLWIEADQALFYSALSNLIQNALKYSHEGGKIQLRAHATDKKVIIEVEDECGGLPANKAADLFKPFEQHHDNRSGLGLGLSIARQAIQSHKGTLEVKDLPKKGCIFTITLPLRQQS